MVSMTFLELLVALPIIIKMVYLQNKEVPCYKQKAFRAEGFSQDHLSRHRGQLFEVIAEAEIDIVQQAAI